MRTLVFAGHNLVFARALIAHFSSLPEYRVLIDQWQTHTRHDAEHSYRCLLAADVVICEWGLGNAVWYSRRRLPAQRLIVRVHAQELRTEHVRRWRLRNIDRIVCISPRIMARLHEDVGVPSSTTDLIYNTLEPTLADLGKRDDASFHLGMLGYCPRLKRPDRALDILEQLIVRDDRYVLHVKGADPRSLHWLWSKSDERKYYEEMALRFQRLEANGHVVVEPWTPDIRDWFPRVGYILSTSDAEGSHQAVAEGMLSGTVPVCLEWDGVRDLYPGLFIHNSVDAAAEFIWNSCRNGGWVELSASARRYAMDRFDQVRSLGQWERLVSELANRRRTGLGIRLLKIFVGRTRMLAHRQKQKLRSLVMRARG